MNYLTMDAQAFLAKHENNLWGRLKMYFADNQEFFVQAAIMLCGNYSAYQMMLNR